MTITIKTVALRAMAHLIAVKDVRYLCGALIEYTPVETRIVATDGHLMGIHHTVGEGLNTDTGKLIIPSDVIKEITKGKHDAITLEANASLERGYTATYGAASRVFQAIDGTFPDYRRVFPKSPVSGVAAQYDPRLLVRFQKVADTLRGVQSSTPIEITHNGDGSGRRVDGCAVVTIAGHTDEFAGILMPFRSGGNLELCAPSWL